MGTVPYMSPEQVEGRAVDHRTDVFSLGRDPLRDGGGTALAAGRTDESIAFLSRGVEMRDPMALLSSVLPEWESLRRRPEHDALLARLGLRPGA